MDSSISTKAVPTVSLADFSRLVSSIHAAAITPDHWGAVLSAVRDTLGGISGAMIMADEASRIIKSADLPGDAREAYVEHYRELDYVLDAVERSPVGTMQSGTSLIALNPQSEFNHDWMRPHHMDDGIFVRLTDGPQPTCFLVASPRRDEPFASTERLALVEALIPHLQQALRTQDHLAELAHEADDLAEAVDGMRHGVFVVGPGSAVRYHNRTAEDIVAAGDGPRVRSGRLGLKIPSNDAELYHGILNAMGCNESGLRCGSSLLCPRPDGRRSYVVHVVPFRSFASDGDEPRALVIVVDPERQAEPPRELLNRLYGLTRAEAEIALRVLRGEGLKPISEDISLSMATVKTHLQHVFCKTQTHRQAELVRLLLTIIP
ncbi:MAG: LuxR C-terminal-related transcriptional regulator [Mycobacterium sp.]